MAALTDALTILERLIGFDTTSHRSNLPLIDYVESYLASHGIKSMRIHNKEKSKAGLLASIGQGTAGGVVMSGHTDVVPVEDQEWHTDPFALVEKNGKLYGRGTSDMKSFLAVCLACVPEWVKLPPLRPVHLAFSYDEEIGCLSAPQIARFLKEQDIAPDLLLIGEPTSMQVVNAHKGIRSFETVVTGKEAHSSNTHKGVSAVMVAAELMHFLNDAAEERKRTGDPSGRFDPPYTTIHVGKISGGTARNIMAKRCTFLWEIRPIPGDNWEALLESFESFCVLQQERMRQVGKETSIVTRPVSAVPELHPMRDSALESLLMSAAESNHLHAVSYGSEGGIFQQNGFPVLVCGPGDIAQAHAPDEFIETQQIERCLRFMQRLTERLLQRA